MKLPSTQQLLRCLAKLAVLGALSNSQNFDVSLAVTKVATLWEFLLIIYECRNKNS
jgi:hypothetical protein